MTGSGLTRGKLARRAGCNVETVRYYERVGLLPQPPRTESGYRSYGALHEDRLRLVLGARLLGFRVDEIKRLLVLIDSGSYRCGEVRRLTLEHLTEIRRKIAALQQLEHALEQYLATCVRFDEPRCPMLDSLKRAKSAATLSA